MRYPLFTFQLLLLVRYTAVGYSQADHRHLPIRLRPSVRVTSSTCHFNCLPFGRHNSVDSFGPKPGHFRQPAAPLDCRLRSIKLDQLCLLKPPSSANITFRLAPLINPPARADFARFDSEHVKIYQFDLAIVHHYKGSLERKHVGESVPSRTPTFRVPGHSESPCGVRSKRFPTQRSLTRVDLNAATRCKALRQSFNRAPTCINRRK